MPATWRVSKLAWKNWGKKPLPDREYMSRTKTFSQARAQARKSPKSKAPSRTGPFLTGKKLYAALCVLLAMATIGLYSPAIGHSFVVLDDREYVTANPNIHGVLGWSTIHWAFTTTYAANWHPLTWLSHALDYQFFGPNPAGHHLDSVLIHALNAVLLFLLLGWVTKRVGPSLLVAALFAVHPINVESVAWVAERKNVLSTLFFFLAIGAYGWYARKPDWRRYLLVAVLFAAGLMAKPMVITLPFVLLLLDYWPLNRTPLDETQSGLASSNDLPRVAFSRLLLEKIPLLFLSAASAWLTLKSQRAAVRTFEELPLAIRVENAVVAYGLYLWKMLFPARLALYPHSVIALPAWQWILSSLVLISVTALVVAFRRKRYLPIGWFWFLGTLIPVIGLVQVGEYAMADRYAYVPLIGIFVMIAWSLSDVADAKKVRPAWCTAAGLLVVGALAWVTVHQIGYWESDYDLYSHTLELQESPFAHNALGMALMNASSEMTARDLENFSSEPARIDAARDHFERALELHDAMQGGDASQWDKARTLNNLGNLDRMQNRLDDARQHQEEALKIYRRLAQQNPEAYLPYLAVTLNNVGSIERMQNHPEAARQDYAESLSINRELAQRDPAKYLPNMAMILNEYGMLDATQGRIDESRAHYEEALKINRELAAQSPSVYLPQLAMTLANFALLDAYQHRLDDARQLYDEALKIDRQLAAENPDVHLPELAMTLTNLGRVEQLQNRVDDARAHYEEAYTLLQKLSQGNTAAYARQIAQVENSLAELKQQSRAQQ